MSRQLLYLPTIVLRTESTAHLLVVLFMAQITADKKKVLCHIGDYTRKGKDHRSTAGREHIFHTFTG